MTSQSHYIVIHTPNSFTSSRMILGVVCLRHDFSSMSPPPGRQHARVVLPSSSLHGHKIFPLFRRRPFINFFFCFGFDARRYAPFPPILLAVFVRKSCSATSTSRCSFLLSWSPFSLSFPPTTGRLSHHANFSPFPPLISTRGSPPFFPLYCFCCRLDALPLTNFWLLV